MKNTTIILFGATGDLAKRKLIPALYRFIVHGRFDNVIIVGTAFDNVTKDIMLEAARPFIQKIDEEKWKVLLDHSYYKSINFTQKNDYVALEEFVKECEKKHGSTSNNRLFYCAVAAYFFCDITENIAQAGIAKRTESNASVWHRIVYEKPFGHDVHSAYKINKCIARFFDESQIYRIDHYLTKEIVSNIAMMRFTNCFFEPLWSNRYIDQIQIIVSESVGIEGRGLYYDQYGALRDVVQNHMLELLALVAMEAPEKLTGDFIRAERVKVLNNVRFVNGFLGQYDSYKKEKDVAQDSVTDTYASIMLMVDNIRWKGVPFYLKTGKYLKKKETVIHIKFKQVDCLLLRGCPTDSNWLSIKIFPDMAFVLSINAKSPTSPNTIVPVAMEFCHSCVFGLQTPEAYEVLFEEVIRGEQSISVRSDEIEALWNVIDYIITQKLPLYSYKIGSDGPDEENLYMQQQGMRWHS